MLGRLSEVIYKCMFSNGFDGFSSLVYGLIMINNNYYYYYYCLSTVTQHIHRLEGSPILPRFQQRHAILDTHNALRRKIALRWPSRMMASNMKKMVSCHKKIAMNDLRHLYSTIDIIYITITLVYSIPIQRSVTLIHCPCREIAWNVWRQIVSLKPEYN